MRIFNKKLNAYTTLYIANKSLTNDQAIAAGCDPAHAPYTGAQIPKSADNTTVQFYITAVDDRGEQTFDPTNAPTDTYSYTVKNSNIETERTVGLIYSDQRAWEGYTLFAPKHNTMTYLIDNQGRVVHSWNASKYEPGQSVYLLENGHLLRTCFKKGGGLTGGGEGGRIEEYDWDDNPVWEFDYATDDYMSHHDIHVFPNSTCPILRD